MVQGHSHETTPKAYPSPNILPGNRSEKTARTMARSSTRGRKRRKRRGGSGPDTEASSQSSSSPEASKEEAAGAKESGAGPGQDGDTTDSDDEGVLGVCYSWAKKCTGTRGEAAHSLSNASS